MASWKYIFQFQGCAFPSRGSDTNFNGIHLQDLFVMVFMFLLFGSFTTSADVITSQVFGNADGYPAAFGDFNSDKKTDLFLISTDYQSFSVLLAGGKNPYFEDKSIKCSLKDKKILSILPGDFDGDAVLDVLVVTGSAPYELHVFYGNLSTIECPTDSKPVLKVSIQPLLFDYNGDMIVDLLTTCENKENRCIWMFDDSKKLISVPMNGSAFRMPPSNSIIDLNGDMRSDLMITSKDNFEYWYYVENQFVLTQTIPYKNVSENFNIIGQSVFVDLDFSGTVDHIVPICTDAKCQSSFIYVQHHGKWVKLDISFKDKENNIWGFVYPNGQKYTDTITLRMGDFTLDGYPDLLVTMEKKNSSPSTPKVFFLENVVCKNCEYSRTFQIKWDMLNLWNESCLGVFFDLFEDGTLDILLLAKNSSTSSKDYQLAAYANTMYEAETFLSVIVASGLCYGNCSMKRDIAYGTNYPGPTVCYQTTSVVGVTTSTCAGQLYQSSHFALQLPYTHFGLGPVLQYIDLLRIGISLPMNDSSHEWTQLIPNSQITGIPFPKTVPSEWQLKLFVTRTKNIFYAFGALLGLMIFVGGLVIILHWKERIEDRKEKLQETQRFHFDAL